MVRDGELAEGIPVPVRSTVALSMCTENGTTWAAYDGSTRSVRDSGLLVSDTGGSVCVGCFALQASASSARQAEREIRWRMDRECISAGIACLLPGSITRRR